VGNRQKGEAKKMSPDEIEAWRAAFPQCEFLDGAIRTKPDEIDVRKLMSEQNERIKELEDYSTRLREENERLAGALDDLVMAVELPGDHCELKPALERARRALSGEPTP
jgi:hypothetical protein